MPARSVSTRPINRQRSLLAKLEVATARSRRSRVARLVRSPWKTLCLDLLTITNLSLARKARTFWGGTMSTILPEIVSQDIWRYGFFDREVCLFMLKTLQPGHTFIDIGAHFGFFTLMGSYLVGPEGSVTAIEAMPSIYDQLLKNISEHAPHANAQAYNFAAYSEPRAIVFYDYGVRYSAFSSAFGFRDQPLGIETKHEVVVQARPADELLLGGDLERVDLVKIDAESSELHVLEGMKHTIETFWPKIILELGDFGISGVPASIELVIWLEKLGYVPYELRGGDIVVHTKWESYPYCNLLFSKGPRVR